MCPARVRLHEQSKSRTYFGRRDFGPQDTGRQEVWPPEHRSLRCRPAGFQERLRPSRGTSGRLPPTTSRAAILNPPLAGEDFRPLSRSAPLSVIQQLTPQSGDAFYVETAQLMDSRHIATTSYQQRVQSALDHLNIALETPSFQKAIGITNRSDIQGLQRELAAYRQQVRLKTCNRPSVRCTRLAACSPSI